MASNEVPRSGAQRSGSEFTSERNAGLLHLVQRYANALDGDGVPVAVLDPNGVVLTANAALAKALGLGSARVPRRGITDLVHPQDRARIASLIERVASEQPQSPAEPVRVRRADGSVLLGLVFGVARAEDGARVAALVLAAPDRVLDAPGIPTATGPVRAVLLFDRAGHIVLADRGATTSGVSAEAIVGISALLLMHPGDVPAITEAIESLTGERAPEHVSIGLRLLQDDGSWAAHRGDLRLVAGANDAQAFLLACTDARRASPVTPDRFPELTDRELEVLSRLVDGQRVRTMAAELYVSESTVRGHLSSVFRKLGVRSQIELTERFRAERG